MKRTFKKRIAFVLSLVMLLTGMNLFVFSTAAAGIVAGDINGDKKVNTKDLTRLMRYIALEFEGVEVVAEAVDTNGDNSVNTMDLTHLMRYMAGDDVVIYPIEPENPSEPSDPPSTQYTVTFKDYDGTVLKTETVNQGESATPPADPTREGYEFAGWDGSYTNVTSDSIVTAAYTEISSGEYTVTFYDYDGMTVLATRTGIAAGGYAEPPANPTKAGATFLGWSGIYAGVSNNENVRAVYSDEKNVIILESANGSVGETVTVLASIDGKVKTCGFDLELSYAPELELVDFDSDLDLDVTANTEGDNQVFLNFSSTTDKTKQRDIIELTFSIGNTSKAALPINAIVNSIKEISGYNPVDTSYVVVNSVISVNH